MVKSEQSPRENSGGSQSDIMSDESIFECPVIEEDGFLKHQSEMYAYLQRPEFKADQVCINSLDDVIEDFERKQRNIENLKFSIVEM